MGRVPFPPLPTDIGARPQVTASPEAEAVRLVEGAGVEPAKPEGRLGYNQGISPVNAPPNLELTTGIEPATYCLQDSCSAI